MNEPLVAERDGRSMDKSPDAFRTISEVAEDLDLPQHVLRFWETRFTHIKPLKRGGGRRYYRPDDVELLKGIRQLLYGQGYTIKGVQRILKEGGVRSVQAIGRGEKPAGLPPAGPSDRDDEEGVLDRADAEGTEREGPGAAPRERAAAAVNAAAAGRIAPEDVSRLKSALDDLAECERLIEALNARDEPQSA
jgi:DNA-binding transcriptional MerR regulator